MADTKNNLEILRNLSKILGRIAKNPVNIAIFTILNQTTQDSGLTVETIIKQIEGTFGNSSFGTDEIRVRLSRLVSRGWIEKVWRTPGVVTPRYEYNLSTDGQIIAKFCQEMLGVLNANILEEE